MKGNKIPETLHFLKLPFTLHFMKIDGTVVEKDAISNEIARLEKSQADMPDKMRVSEEKIREMAEDNIITGMVMRTEGRRLFPEIPEKDVKTKRKELEKRYGPTINLEPLEDHIKDEIRVDWLIRDAYHQVPTPSEEELQARYDDNPGTWAKPEQVHCSRLWKPSG